MTETTTDFRTERPRATRFILTTGAVGVFLLIVGAVLGLLQILYRAGYDVLPSPGAYYSILTAHGTLLAYGFTFFFSSGVMAYFLSRGLERDLPRPGVAWTGFGLMAAGVILWVLPIIREEAAVLWTFYVPLQANAIFYLGLGTFIVGSWVLSVGGLAWAFRSRKRAHFPLMVHGTVATLLLWVVTSAALATTVLVFALPWALGWTPTPNPALTRSLFWLTGHPLVYVWLLPAYVAWYTVFPTVAGGRLFSDPLGRVVFILLFLFSIPVGAHHQFEDPGIGNSWKALHMMNTMVVIVPSLLTLFTIVASLEYAGRRHGGRGLIGWIPRLPWKNPAFGAFIVAFASLGGAGVSGTINAAFNLNAIVHNTMWVVAHFHVALATSVVLTFIGFAYWALPQLTGRALAYPRVATWQPYVWLGGILLFATSLYEAGIFRGLPRRIARAGYRNIDAATGWEMPQMIASVGGALMLLSFLMFLAVVLGTAFGRSREPRGGPEAGLLNPPLNGAGPRILDRWGIWVGVGILLLLAGWGMPLWHVIQQHGGFL